MLWQGPPLILLEGDRRLRVHGCRGILYYAPERICFSVGHRVLEASGRGMLCSSFSCGAVTVIGEFSSVRFLDVESEGKE